MKLIVNMACGLANRMFQYSYYLFLKKKGFDVNVDFYHSAKLAHEHVMWNTIFPHALIEQAAKMEVFKLGGGADAISRFRRKYLPVLTGVINMPTAFDIDLKLEDDKDKYIIGVFQNAEMVTEVDQEIKQCFSFLPFKDDHNCQLEKEMGECESVAIHVRKGDDYRQRIWYKNTCPVEYYQKAIYLFQEEVHNPRFYVFTDNPAWVKENFLGLDYKLVEGNPINGWGSHFDMQLMGCCKHNIISNSTYSWWGAYLNNNPGKKVVCPHIWFNPESCENFTSQKLVCRDWTVL